MWIAKTGTVVFFAIIVQAQLSGRTAADDRGELTTYQFDLTYCQGWTERRDILNLISILNSLKRLKVESEE